MKTKIFAHLKTKLPGVPDAYLQGVADQYSKTITDEAQIATAINDGTIEVLRTSALYAQQEGDRRAQGAQKTALDEFRKKHNLDENGKPIQNPNPQPNPTPGVVGEEMPASVKQAIEMQGQQIAKLMGIVEQQNAAKTRDSKIQQIQSKLKAKGIDDSVLDVWGGLVNVDSETLDSDIDAVAARYVESKQADINKQIASGVLTPNASGRPIAEDAELLALMNKDNGDQPKVGVTPLI